MVDKTLPSFQPVFQELKNSETSTADKILQRRQTRSDVNGILGFELDEPDFEPKHLKKSAKLEKIKCCPTLIGGVDLSTGCGQLTTPRTCSALHCRDCDFSISSFPDHEWMETVEYLFLRTNMPHSQKIFERLRRKDGTVAYACHCVCFSAGKIQRLHEVNLPWFCKGHF